MNSKKLKEKQIFTEFAKKAPYEIILDKIENREPPEPDILCQLTNGKSILFELSESIYKSMAQSINNASDFPRIFNEELEKLQADKRNRIKRLYKDASIYVVYTKELTKKKRKTEIPKIFDFLLTLNERAVGEFNLISNPSFKNKIKRILISRNYPLLSFNVEGAGGYIDPIIERIKTKFEQYPQYYDLDCEAELLIYYEFDTVPFDELWLNPIKSYIENNIRHSIFNRVWIYSVTQNKILYVYPNI